ncbi:MAG: hypothetical protein EOO48_12085 [Flavobacterium sp.]|nr:MAG: hypothetical protein EOO48_12085 [Flavobacterium sp.]
MKHAILSLAAIFFFCLSAAAQETKSETVSVSLPDVFTPDSTSYPAGVYFEIKDFLAKKPSKAERNSPIFWKKGFFYFKLDPSEKISAFAVSHDGKLYFQNRAIMDHKIKGGRSESTFSPNAFVPVLVEGNNYIYFETDFGNVWAMVSSRGDGSESFQRMAIVWDRKKIGFHIMKFCEDFNEFIAPLKPELVLKCDRRESPDRTLIRDAVVALKSK